MIFSKEGKKKYFQVLSMIVLMPVLSVLLVPFVRILRRVYGGQVYWLTGFALMLVFSLFKLPFVVLFYFSTWVTIGIYSEFEQSGKGNFWSALLSTIVGGIIFAYGFVPATSGHSLEISELFDRQEGIKNFQEQIIYFGPAISVILMITFLAFSLILEKKLSSFIGLKLNKVASQMKLIRFLLPDIMIWILMGSFLFSFLNLNSTLLVQISSNILAVSLTLYFFQGIAILQTILEIFRVVTSVRALIYILVVGQFLVFFVALGIIDYWADFRKRLIKYSYRKRSHKIGEKI